MSNWKDLLKQLKLQHIQRTAPGFYEQSGGERMKVIPYDDRKANTLTRCIVDFITHIGGSATRINTQGQLRRIGGVMKWTHGTTRKGTADIHAIFCGLHISIEIKIGPDKPSESQIKERSRIVNAGGIYFIAKTFPQFLEEWLAHFPLCISSLPKSKAA